MLGFQTVSFVMAKSDESPDERKQSSALGPIDKRSVDARPEGVPLRRPGQETTEEGAPEESAPLDMSEAARAVALRTDALLEGLSRPSEIPRAHRVYANRNLRLDRVRLVGFDMDYTLALYDQPAMESLSIAATIDKLIGLKGYPKAVRGLAHDPQMGIRGLVVDTTTGHVLKPDRYGQPGRAFHGLQPLAPAAVAELYQRQRVPLGSERFAFIDTLFALPEVVLFAGLVALFDNQSAPGPSYNQLWNDIRECIDLAHRDGSIKHIIAGALSKYIQPDPHLAETLHKMRSSGKKLFILTNSEPSYTEAVMSHLLDGRLEAYPSWRNFFDVVVCSAMKPGFFTQKSPFFEVGPDGDPAGEMKAEPFVRGKMYCGGNHKDFEARAGARGDRVLFVGDHIYGDMLRSRKSSAWRTAMVIQELEHEVGVHDQMSQKLSALYGLDQRLRHLDGEVEEKQHILRSLQKLRSSSQTGQQASLQQAQTKAKSVVDSLRTDLRESMAEHTALEHQIDSSFNPFWGPLLKEGREVSKFGDQVETYACVYTSRVSNFRYYSPMRHFRGPRDKMPHER